MTSSLPRMKCAMIIHTLENALGQYVLNNNFIDLSANEVVKAIALRSRLAADKINNNIELIVQYSYFAEIFNIAKFISQNNTDLIHFERIEKLIESLEIYEIRNAISHPNRRFPDSYWYRCAALASDYSIEQLGFSVVSFSLTKAEEGKIEEPPEEWISGRKWQIPISIPEFTEHHLTGLVGRSKEISALLKEIKSRKNQLICIVARGGIGKTSLIHEVVLNFSLEPEVAGHYDGIIWNTLKQEKLTANGLEILSAPSSLTELKSDIVIKFNEIFHVNYDSFTDVISEFSDRKILLCIDNLETIIRDAEHSFEEFYDLIPSAWKTIVTSRVVLDGAKNISLGPLDLNGATSLLRNYLNAIGEKPIQNELLEKVCVECDCNPLAIRISADLYSNGGDLSEVLDKAKQDIIKFSFDNLLNTLTNNQNNILEAIFSLEKPTRSDLIGILGLDADELAEAISKLCKTSLINRINDKEHEWYELGNSVRDLLRSNPRNLEVRGRAQKWFVDSKQFKNSILEHQKGKNVYPIDMFYLADDASHHEINFMKRLISVSFGGNRDELVQLEKDVNKVIGANGHTSVLSRIQGKIYTELFDNIKSKECYLRAISLDPNDPSPRFSYILLNQKADPSGCHEHASFLFKNGWASTLKSGPRHGNHCFSLYLHLCNVIGNLDEVFTQTMNAKLKFDDMPFLAVERASAYRRQLDSERYGESFSVERMGDMLSKAAELLLGVIKIHGLTKICSNELKKFLGEILFYDEKNVDFQNLMEDQLIQLRALVFELNDYVSEVNRFNLTELVVNAASILRISIESNNVDYGYYLNEGYTLCKIKPGIQQTFFFVRDSNTTNEYYVRKDRVKSQGEMQAVGNFHIYVGRDVAIKYAVMEDGKTFATECVLL